MRAMLLMGLTFLLTAPAAADEPDLTCETGPVIKTFAETQWKVFSCNEERHLMFIAVPGSSAGQMLFMVFWENGHWLVMDMGSSTSAASAAHSEIQSLSDADLMGLIAETKAH